MKAPRCKTCEYRARNKCTRAGAILYMINQNHPRDVLIKTRPRWCPLKGMRNEEIRG